MKPIRTTFRELFEVIPSIAYKNKQLIWNPNKTEHEWIQRITQRTHPTSSDFYEVLQKGLNSVKLPEHVSICLYFMKSKFVLILNTRDSIITTIRDGKWEKTTSSCKHVKITNEDILKDSELVDLLNDGSEYWDIDVDENFDVLIESKCNICFKIEF